MTGAVAEPALPDLAGIVVGLGLPGMVVEPVLPDRIFEFGPSILPDVAAELDLPELLDLLDRTAELDLPELIDPPDRAAGFGLPDRAAGLDRAELSDKAAEHSCMVAGPVLPDRAAPPDMPGSAVVPVLPVQAQTASDLPDRPTN